MDGDIDEGAMEFENDGMESMSGEDDSCGRGRERGCDSKKSDTENRKKKT